MGAIILVKDLKVGDWVKKNNAQWRVLSIGPNGVRIQKIDSLNEQIILPYKIKSNLQLIEVVEPPYSTCFVCGDKIYAAIISADTELPWQVPCGVSFIGGSNFGSTVTFSICKSYISRF